jgi:hypothetical protein
MDADSVEQAASTLLGAYATRAPVLPLTATYPDISVDDAYAIQLAQTSAWVKDGAVVKGHKVGLTSAAMQRQMGVDTPDFGVLLDSMFVAEGVTCDITRFLQPASRHCTSNAARPGLRRIAKTRTSNELMEFPPLKQQEPHNFSRSREGSPRYCAPAVSPRRWPPHRPNRNRRHPDSNAEWRP